MPPTRAPIPSASRSACRDRAAASTSRATSAAFVQDKWKLNRKLTLSLGLRYDLEMIPIPEIDNPLFVGSGDAPVDTNNIQPRIGVAYDMDGRSVARGGYGRFYDKTHFELIGGIYTGTVFATSFVRNFPLANADPGPRLGQFPDRSVPRQRSSHHRRDARRAGQAVPAGTDHPQYRRRDVGQPRPAHGLHRPGDGRLRAAARLTSSRQASTTSTPSAATC